VSIIPEDRWPIFFDCPAAITPEPRHPRHAQEILDRLQTLTVPSVFHPKALYDGQAILFASHQLNLSGGGSGNVSIHPDFEFAGLTLHICSLMCSCPTDRRRLVHPSAACTASSLHVLQLRPSTSRKYAMLTRLIKVNMPIHIYICRALSDFIAGRGASSPRTLTAINILQLLIRAAPNL
jgi:eukaryotic translation initiation factor 2C